MTVEQPVDPAMAAPSSEAAEATKPAAAPAVDNADTKPAATVAPERTATAQSLKLAGEVNITEEALTPALTSGTDGTVPASTLAHLDTGEAEGNTLGVAIEPLIRSGVVFKRRGTPLLPWNKVYLALGGRALRLEQLSVYYQRYSKKMGKKVVNVREEKEEKDDEVKEEAKEEVKEDKDEVREETSEAKDEDKKSDHEDKDEVAPAVQEEILKEEKMVKLPADATPQPHTMPQPFLRNIALACTDPSNLLFWHKSSAPEHLAYPLGIVNLGEVTKIEPISNVGRNNAFALSTETRRYVFCTNSADETSKWIKTLEPKMGKKVESERYEEVLESLSTGTAVRKLLKKTPGGTTETDFETDDREEEPVGPVARISRLLFGGGAKKAHETHDEESKKVKEDDKDADVIVEERAVEEEDEKDEEEKKDEHEHEHDHLKDKRKSRFNIPLWHKRSRADAAAPIEEKEKDEHKDEVKDETEVAEHDEVKDKEVDDAEVKEVKDEHKSDDEHPEDKKEKGGIMRYMKGFTTPRTQSRSASKKVEEKKEDEAKSDAEEEGKEESHDVDVPKVDEPESSDVKDEKEKEDVGTARAKGGQAKFFTTLFRSHSKEPVKEEVKDDEVKEAKAESSDEKEKEAEVVAEPETAEEMKDTHHDKSKGKTRGMSFFGRRKEKEDKNEDEPEAVVVKDEDAEGKVDAEAEKVDEKLKEEEENKDQDTGATGASPRKSAFAGLTTTLPRVFRRQQHEKKDVAKDSEQPKSDDETKETEPAPEIEAEATGEPVEEVFDEVKQKIDEVGKTEDSQDEKEAERKHHQKTMAKRFGSMWRKKEPEHKDDDSVDKVAVKEGDEAHEEDKDEVREGDEDKKAQASTSTKENPMSAAKKRFSAFMSSRAKSPEPVDDKKDPEEAIEAQQEEAEANQEKAEEAAEEAKRSESPATNLAKRFTLFRRKGGELSEEEEKEAHKNAAEETAIVKEGYLTKEGTVLGSKRKYFSILEDGGVQYRRTDRPELRRLNLSADSRVFVPERVKYDTDFHLNVAGDMTIKLQAASDEERKEWMEAIQKVIDARKVAAAVVEDEQAPVEENVPLAEQVPEEKKEEVAKAETDHKADEAEVKPAVEEAKGELAAPVEEPKTETKEDVPAPEVVEPAADKGKEPVADKTEE